MTEDKMFKIRISEEISNEDIYSDCRSCPDLYSDLNEKIGI